MTRSKAKKNTKTITTTIQKQQNQGRKNRRRVVRLRRQPLHAGMSECAQRYMAVLNNPFSGATACVPSEFNFPTMKHSVRCSGTFSTSSTSGFGCVFLSPWQAMYLHSSPTTHGAVGFTDGTYLGTTFPAPFAAVTGVTYQDTNTPYSSADTAARTSGRLVAAGLRVRNTTANLSRGGILIGSETLNHTDLGGETIASLLNQDTSERCSSITEKWTSIVFHPQQAQEIGFLSGASTDNSANGFSSAVLGFAAQTPASSPQTYEWEAFVAFEVKGESAHGLSPSESDPVGFAKVQNLTSSVDQRKPRSMSEDGSWLSRAAEIGGTLAGFGTTAYTAYKNSSRQRRNQPQIEYSHMELD